jgi:neutral ceramidase
VLGVFKVESTAGELIALLVNGGPEPVMGMSMNTKIGSDVAGVMERYIEQRFSDKAVVLYTVGSPPQLVKTPGSASRAPSQPIQMC